MGRDENRGGRVRRGSRGPGANWDDATTFWAQIPAIDALLSGAEAAAAQAIDAVSEAFAAHERPDGVWLGSAAWLVTASRS